MNKVLSSQRLERLPFRAWNSNPGNSHTILLLLGKLLEATSHQWMFGPTGIGDRPGLRILTGETGLTVSRWLTLRTTDKLGLRVYDPASSGSGFPAFYPPVRIKASVTICWPLLGMWLGWEVGSSKRGHWLYFQKVCSLFGRQRCNQRRHFIEKMGALLGFEGQGPYQLIRKMRIEH
jgi:hypothetical protein